MGGESVQVKPKAHMSIWITGYYSFVRSCSPCPLHYVVIIVKFCVGTSKNIFKVVHKLLTFVTIKNQKQ